jgi:hypothetical protein
MSKTFRTARSQSKYTNRYCVNWEVENEQTPRRVLFLNSLREVRALVAQLKAQGYVEEKTSLSLTL